MKTAKFLLWTLAITAVLSTHGHANPIRSGFDQEVLPANDDFSSDSVPMGFTIDFFGQNHGTVYVNNNGNVTFAGPRSAYTPQSLAGLGIEIIAPFWADVDTRSADSDVVKYGTGTVNGHGAFGVDWVNVGYYSGHGDKLLSCQLVIIDRSDIGAGDFDLEFNYAKVQWQWGDVTLNIPARAGFASDLGGSYELAGSGVSGAFLDTNLETGLIYNSLNCSEPGRYFFSFRDGIPVAVPEPSTMALAGAGLLLAVISTRRRGRF